MSTNGACWCYVRSWIVLTRHSVGYRSVPFNSRTLPALMNVSRMPSTPHASKAERRDGASTRYRCEWYVFCLTPEDPKKGDVYGATDYTWGWRRLWFGRRYGKSVDDVEIQGNVHLALICPGGRIWSEIPGMVKAKYLIWWLQRWLLTALTVVNELPPLSVRYWSKKWPLVGCITLASKLTDLYSNQVFVSQTPKQSKALFQKRSYVANYINRIS
jgi:hypothetical protein